MVSVNEKRRVFQSVLVEGWGPIESDGPHLRARARERAVLAVPPGAVFLDVQVEAPALEKARGRQRVRLEADRGRRAALVHDGSYQHMQIRCEGARWIELTCEPLDGAAPVGVTLANIVPVTPDMTPEAYFDRALAYIDHEPDLKRIWVATHAEKDREGEYLWEVLQARGLVGAGSRVLDCGAGAGGVSIAMGRRGARMAALDLSSWYLSMARANAFLSGVDLSLLRGDAQALSFPDGCFDLVMGLDILEHVPRPDAMLGEFHRVLRPGGVCVWRTGFAWNPHNIRRDPHYQVPGIVLLPRWARKFIVTRVARKGSDVDDWRWFRTFGDLRRFARRCGFDLQPLEPEQIDAHRELARSQRGPRGWIKRGLFGLLPERATENLYTTRKDWHVLARRIDDR